MTGGGLTLTRITIALLFIFIAYLASRIMKSKASLMGERQKNDNLKKENKLLKEIITKFKEGEYTKDKLFEEFQYTTNKYKN